MLLGVEHLVRQFFLFEELRQQLGILDRRRADQHRLAAGMAILDVTDDRVDIFLEGAANEIVLILANHRQVSRDHHGFQVIDLLEFECFGVRRSGHSRKLVVHPEIVLERD